MSIPVMIVDDQKPTRVGLSLIVRKAPDMMVLECAENGAQALEQLRMRAANAQLMPAVILMDVRMPVMNGIDATAHIARFYPQVKILILTTYDQDDYAYGALNAGAAGFLLKDTSTTDLHAAIRAVAAGDAVLTPRITRQLLNQHMRTTALTPEQRRAREIIHTLSPRESQIATLVAQGLSNAEIAEALVLQTESVKKSVTRILAKTALRDRVQLVITLRDASLTRE